jgi:hypothetical protein
MSIAPNVKIGAGGKRDKQHSPSGEFGQDKGNEIGYRGWSLSSGFPIDLE